MDNGIQLSLNSGRERSITLHPELFKALMLKNSKIGQIKLGIRSFPIEVTLNPQLQLNQVSLSTDIVKMLDIPLNCMYEIHQKDNEIQIGPYIGLLAGFNQKTVKKNLDGLLDYLYHYSEIKGAIIAFSLDKVNIGNQTVDGYLYNPVTNGWDEGTFPYPASIFIITGTVSSKWIEHFHSVIGDCIFNDFYLNKWSIHKILDSSHFLKEFLPTSILYNTPQDIYSFLKNYPNIIVKSINASKGSAIYKIELNENIIIISYPKTGETTKIQLENREEANTLFKKYFEEKEFMIQEALQLITFKNRTIDFRVIVVKNGDGQWQVMGMFARHGQPGNILSNISPIVKPGEETLKEVLKLSNLEVSALIKKIYQISIEAVKALEQRKIHFANTGVDISIDKNGKINIIEIQHCNPSHDIALEAGFPEQYYEILKTNLLYAKKLAGF